MSASAAAEAARREAERWGRKLNHWIWQVKTTQPVGERAILLESKAHEAAVEAAHHARLYLRQA